MYYKLVTAGDDLALAELELELCPVFNLQSENFRERCFQRGMAIASQIDRYKISEDIKAEYRNELMKIQSLFSNDEDMSFITALYVHRQEIFKVSQQKWELRAAEVFKSWLASPKSQDFLTYFQMSCFVVADENMEKEIIRACAEVAKNYPPELEARRAIYGAMFKDQPGDALTEFEEHQRFYPVQELVPAAKDFLLLRGETQAYRLRLAQLPFKVLDDGVDVKLAFARFIRQLPALKTDVPGHAKRAALQVVADRRARGQRALMSFQECLNSGFDFGPIGQKNRAIYEDYQAKWNVPLNKIKEEMQQPGTEQKKLTGTDDAKNAIVAESWSTHFQRRKKKPVKKKTVKRRRNVEPRNSNLETGPLETEPLPIIDLPVQQIEVPDEQPHFIAQGLRLQLQAKLQELGDALFLAGDLKLTEDIQQLQDKRLTLEALISKEVIEEEEASSLLESLDEPLQEFRAVLERRQEQTLLLEGFHDALMQALNDEAPVFGKRFGGVINHPINLNNWGLINQAYHNRLIPVFDRIWLNGRWRYLHSYESIAFYVTFSSNSGYAFDISAHLWRRRFDAGDAPPVEDWTEALPLMDDYNWYDTYVPLFVLHIPNLQ